MQWKARGMKQPVVMRLTAPDYHDDAGAIRIANAVVASGATMLKMRAGARPDCENIPNGVDSSLFRPHASDFRTRRGIGDDEFVVLFAARFQSVKNHRMLVKAFSRLRADVPRSRLVLAGSGPLESDIRKLCSEMDLGGQVLFLGEFPFRELPGVYAAADAGVVSSDYESFCFAALEAMATALPMVVTDTHWVPGLIGCPTNPIPPFPHPPHPPHPPVLLAPGGLVVPKGNDAAMAEAFTRLAGDAELRKRMGSYNREKVVAEFGWDQSARKLLALYQRLLTTDHGLRTTDNRSPITGNQ
jgi:glycosyltransferase involved in cell wall biosynthesis